jgi:hypothetical protein
MICGKEPMAGNLKPDTRARLVERLIELRDDALGRMLRRGAVELGHLPLIAGINAALDALDRMSDETTSAARSVVSDDGSTIRLTLYSEASAVASVALDPVRAVALAGRLIEAALPRLSLPSCYRHPSDRPQDRSGTALGLATAASRARRY